MGGFTRHWSRPNNACSRLRRPLRAYLDKTGVSAIRILLFSILRFVFCFLRQSRRRRAAMGHGMADPPPTVDWAPTPTRCKPPSKICRTKNPESPRNLVGGVMINRRSAMQSLTPTSGISGASLPKGVSTSVVARLRCTFLLKNCAVFRIAFLRAAT